MSKELNIKNGNGISLDMNESEGSLTINSNIVLNTLSGNETDKAPSINLISFLLDRTFFYKGELPSGDINSVDYWKALGMGSYRATPDANIINKHSDWAMVLIWAPNNDPNDKEIIWFARVRGPIYVAGISDSTPTVIWDKLAFVTDIPKSFNKIKVGDTIITA